MSDQNNNMPENENVQGQNGQDNAQNAHIYYSLFYCVLRVM